MTTKEWLLRFLREELQDLQDPDVLQVWCGLAKEEKVKRFEESITLVEQGSEAT